MPRIRSEHTRRHATAAVWIRRQPLVVGVWRRLLFAGHVLFRLRRDWLGSIFQSSHASLTRAAWHRFYLWGREEQASAGRAPLARRSCICWGRLLHVADEEARWKQVEATSRALLDWSYALLFLSLNARLYFVLTSLFPLPPFFFYAAGRC